MFAALRVIQEQIEQATSAAKCHGCGCFQQTVRALTGAVPELATTWSRAETTFVAKKYDCLGCGVCYPAVAANAFVEAFPGEADTLDLCPVEPPALRAGWPPLPGDHRALRFDAPVAVCTLHSTELVSALAEQASPPLAIVGSMHTENLGIERLVQNVVANPHIRVLLLCGRDTQQSVGHLPGQTLRSLWAHGTDDRGRIIGARGKRPVIKNVTGETVEAFRRQVMLVSMIGETDASTIAAEIERHASQAPALSAAVPPPAPTHRIQAASPARLVQDPAGYFVIYPDPRSRRLQVEHFTNAGVLTCVVEGEAPAAIYAELIARRLLTRLDHAAYLGQELARAERALATGERYVQDRAAGSIDDCGCAPGCGAGGGR